jgi:hypothetical protein
MKGTLRAGYQGMIRGVLNPAHQLEDLARLNSNKAPMKPMRAAGVAMLSLMLSCPAITAQAFRAADADTLWQAHATAFYREHEGRGWFLESTDGGKTSYWMRAEQMEMVLDSYERSTNAQLLVMFTNLFRGFLADHGTNWAHNEYNDDIMWMVIACSRAHLLTGNREFRDVARTNFDLCYARAASTNLGGGL